MWMVRIGVTPRKALRVSRAFITLYNRFTYEIMLCVCYVCGPNPLERKKERNYVYLDANEQKDKQNLNLHTSLREQISITIIIIPIIIIIRIIRAFLVSSGFARNGLHA
jgi:hypothetical protein